MREITGTGWLSPDGEFFPCESYSHIATAERIVNKIGLIEKGIRSEDKLRSLGWIAIIFHRFVEHGFDFSYNWRVNHSDIQVKMISEFAERSDIRSRISSGGIFHIKTLKEKEE